MVDAHWCVIVYFVEYSLSACMMGNALLWDGSLGQRRAQRERRTRDVASLDRKQCRLKRQLG